MNYKNNSALYTVTLKDYDSTAGAFDAVKDVIDALSDEKHIYPVNLHFHTTQNLKLNKA